MKNNITSLIKEILIGLGMADVEPQLSRSERMEHGEYTSNVAMVAYAKSKFKNPKEFAAEIKKIIDAARLPHEAKNSDQITDQIDQKLLEKLRKFSVLQEIERVEIAGPGFINFYILASSLSSSVTELLKDEKSVTSASSVKYQVSSKNMTHDTLTPDASLKKVMVEYTDPNPFKELHVGHLYSNAVGESLARLYEAIGWEVKRADYFGDVGMHVAKSIYGLKKLMQNTTNLGELETKPLNERVKFLGQAYAFGATAFEDSTDEGKAAQEEIKKINLLVYVAAQEYMVKEFGWKPVVDYQKLLPVGALQQLPEVKEFFEKGRKWSMDYFEEIFRRLGTKFDYYYPESIVGEYGAKIVKENLGEVFENSDGAVIFRGEKYGSHTRVFMNSLGLPTYEAKELGLNWKKHQDYPADLSLIVTGNEINEYFKVLFSAMQAVIPDVAVKTKHIGHGMVRLPEGKMSSRTGKVITGEWVLSEVKKYVYDYLQKSDAKYNKEVLDEIAEKTSIAAVKYSFLKVALPANLAFDFEKSVSFDGDSGPYLQYTYARCRSVLRKASDKQESDKRQEKKKEVNDLTFSLIADNLSLNPEERAVARLLMYFPEIVSEAAENLAPNVLCTYLFQLAQVFNLFYAKHSILGGIEKVSSVKYQVSDQNMTPDTLTRDTRMFRLALTSAVAQTLKKGLYLLGIETLEQM